MLESKALPMQRVAVHVLYSFARVGEQRFCVTIHSCYKADVFHQNKSPP